MSRVQLKVTFRARLILRMFHFNMKELNNLFSSYKEYIFHLYLEWAVRIQEEIKVALENRRKSRKTRIKEVK